MKIIPLFTIFILSPFALFHVSAADAVERPPLPAGPLPARAPDFASWKIGYTYAILKSAVPMAKPPPDRPAPPPLVQPKETTITKTGTTYYREDISDNGYVLNRWWMNGTQVMAEKNAGPYTISDSGNIDIFTLDYHNSDFPDLAWIGAGCYMGIEKLGGAKCFVFRKLRPVIVDGRALKQPPVETTVWINFETHLPVQKSIPYETETYTFLPPPSAAVTLPPEAEQTLTTYRKRMEELSRRGPPP